MRSAHRAVCLAPLALLIAQGCSDSSGLGGFGSGHKVVLFRPLEVGFTYVEHSTGEHELYEGAFLNGNAIDEMTESAKVDLVVEAQVLTIDGKGQSTGMRYTLQSIHPHSGTTVPPSLVPGSVIEATASSTNIAHSGMPSETEQGLKMLLQMLLSARTPGRGTEDEYMGTKKKVNIGDRWPVDIEGFREAWELDSASLAGATLSGYSKLEDVREVDGIQCHIVYSEFKAENLQVPIPPGARIQSATLFGSNVFTLPADPTLPMVAIESTLSINVHLSSDSGGEVFRTLTNTSKITFEYPNSD